MLGDGVDSFRVNLRVLVHQSIPEAHDQACIGNALSEGRISPRENSYGLTNDGELTLHRRTNRALIGIGAEVNAIEHFGDGIAGSDDVGKVGGRTTRQNYAA